MRLLRHLPDDNFELTSFPTDDPPPYAILSHVGGEDGEEVTYRDLMAGIGREKAGFRKLQFCSQRAELDGLQYFWIDSCCVDRFNKEEMSVGMNSVYNWYQSATRCYVLLADVSVPDGFASDIPLHEQVTDDMDNHEIWQSFRRSRWFEQCWTLQELLAPSCVEFFSREGRRLGNRTSLALEIHQITSIPEAVLRGKNLAECSVEERIGWVVGRSAALEEDKAYCLFGILGVHLPRMYGEGINNAMLRLRERIDRRRSALKMSTGVFMVPFRRDKSFVGRERILSRIGQHTSSGGSHVRAALVGVEGVGKSKIALEYAYIYKSVEPSPTVIWIDASNHVTIQQGYRDIAERLELAGPEISREAIPRIVREWLSQKLNRPWLMILDNLTDNNVFLGDEHNGRAPEILLPYTKHGMILITSRNKRVASNFVGIFGTVVEVGPMDDDDALALLYSSVTSKEITPSLARPLLHHLEGMPLEIAQFALFIKQKSPSLTVMFDYFDRYRESKFQRQQDHNIHHDDDRMSVQSVGSSTLISTFSGLTAVDKSATVELERVFQEDEILIGLYHLALKNTSIGPDRLQRNIARLLQFFAKELRSEAGQNIERMASRFVWTKAQYVAQCIIERFHDIPGDPQRPHLEVKQIKSSVDSVKRDEDQLEVDDVDEVGEVDELAPPNGDDLEDHVELSGAELVVGKDQLEVDDVDEVAPVDEDYFEDLALLRTFLISSSAFQIFRARLTKFVLGKDLHLLGIEDSVQGRSVQAPSSRFARFSISTVRIFKAVLVAAGCLEPPLRPGFIRLRWQCDCGAPLFDDVQEYQIGGISRLMEQVERSTGSKVIATSYNEGASQERYIPGPINWIRETVRNLARAFSKDANRNEMLPRHSGPGTKVTDTSKKGRLPFVQDLLLLACVPQNHGGQILCQDSIEAIRNDRQLFWFIRQQLSRTPNVRWPIQLLKTVTGIHFTKFHLRLNDNVEPRLHDLCCRIDSCQCVPLTSNEDYDCEPAGPLRFGPPILPSQLLHQFKHPELISAKETSVLKQIPKRKCGKIQASGLVAAEGWGLHYEEDWNIVLIIILIVGLTIPASLLFGICWTIIKTDIQGAWGVSSYMVTTSALFVGLLLGGVAKSK
ncbi:hypothetical protein BU24DRAFT_425752 [Aaosphaeria arxii CBS 175.79]|uniref:HET-domain-containing protein n=1 Tax=Aaosphaeria arxii CBS 175.79 TaxID=1450172 RepID=A0A6A5XGH1_9PLEO|nr:uncharacterized protein BU24DRAFT_425752 [Aaosphaeria arxii CBS 175.79]KAF2011921.1 hypothetical protein BU24DRAFT_425752 [Aaosphaeria arxii CBS 175.79]